jgi:putative hydrolase of the HAD superfamily
MKALILDFGGVLTNDFWEVLRGFARREGLDERTFVGLFTRDPEGMELLQGLERGSIGQLRFETELAARLGVPAEGLLQRMGADLHPDEQMLAFVAELRAAGVKIAVLSNSLGSDYYDPYAPWDLTSRADVVIISDQVRLRKPDPEIFDLVLEKLGLPASECLFVDDIAAYLKPAQAMGMAVWHHTSTAETIAELRRVFTG